MKIAVVNSGSSSLKFKLFDLAKDQLLQSVTCENIGEIGSKFQNHDEALESLNIDFKLLDAIAHRVVHGGEYFSKVVLINNNVIKKIEELIPLAPLHNPANLQGIKLVLQKVPEIKQIAVFDTSFHTTLSKEVYRYAINSDMYQKHKIRRYGFHGNSHSYVSKEAAKLLGKDIQDTKLITLHLGNGASACAVKGGKSIDTSMGFTPLEGLVMGTRCGDIDPSIILYMQRELKMDLNQVDYELNKNSGLYGLCGKNDLRQILENSDEDSELAVEMMVRRIQKYIGSYLILLDGIDAVVFTGGIGENSSYIREKVMDKEILKDIRVLVIETDEELEIARQSKSLL